MHRLLVFLKRLVLASGRQDSDDTVTDCKLEARMRRELGRKGIVRPNCARSVIACRLTCTQTFLQNFGS